MTPGGVFDAPDTERVSLRPVDRRKEASYPPARKIPLDSCAALTANRWEIWTFELVPSSVPQIGIEWVDPIERVVLKPTVLGAIQVRFACDCVSGARPACATDHPVPPIVWCHRALWELGIG
jgi:hypothetical protein